MLKIDIFRIKAEKLLFIIFCFLCFHLYSQPALDSGKTDSLLRIIQPNLPNSYYVIAFRLRDAETTLAPQIVKELKSIKEIQQENEKIVFLIKNQQTLPVNQIPQYLISYLNCPKELV